MLAHLQDFDLAPLLGNFNRGHLLFEDGFDCDVVLGGFVGSDVDHAELALAEHILYLVELEEVFDTSDTLE